MREREILEITRYIIFRFNNYEKRYIFVLNDQYNIKMFRYVNLKCISKFSDVNFKE